MTTLPGMPIAAGDPGVFACTIDDGAPRVQLHAIIPAQRPARATLLHIWLVLALCPHCDAVIGRYCHDHGKHNWWLKTMRSRPWADTPTAIGSFRSPAGRFSR